MQKISPRAMLLTSLIMAPVLGTLVAPLVALAAPATNASSTTNAGITTVTTTLTRTVVTKPTKNPNAAGVKNTSATPAKTSTEPATNAPTAAIILVPTAQTKNGFTMSIGPVVSYQQDFFGNGFFGYGAKIALGYNYKNWVFDLETIYTTSDLSLREQGTYKPVLFKDRLLGLGYFRDGIISSDYNYITGSLQTVEFLFSPGYKINIGKTFSITPAALLGVAWQHSKLDINFHAPTFNVGQTGSAAPLGNVELSTLYFDVGAKINMSIKVNDNISFSIDNSISALIASKEITLQQYGYLTGRNFGSYDVQSFATPIIYTGSIGLKAAF